MRPVNRIKHVVDSSATVAAAAVLTTNVILATDTPTIANTIGVETGAKVHGIYLKVEVSSNEAASAGAIPNVYLAVFKNPGGNLSPPAPNAIGANDNKRFVIHQEMILIENSVQGGNPRILFNGVIVIPKGYSRMGPGDVLQVITLAPQLDTAICIQAHYKEFR